MYKYIRGNLACVLEILSTTLRTCKNLGLIFLLLNIDNLFVTVMNIKSVSDSAYSQNWRTRSSFHQIFPNRHLLIQAKRSGSSNQHWKLLFG